jgi:hypothetical protein
VLGTIKNGLKAFSVCMCVWPLCYLVSKPCHRPASTAPAGALLLLLLVHKRDHRAPVGAKERTHAQRPGGSWERLCDRVAGAPAGVAGVVARGRRRQRSSPSRSTQTRGRGGACGCVTSCYSDWHGKTESVKICKTAFYIFSYPTPSGTIQAQIQFNTH